MSVIEDGDELPVPAPVPLRLEFALIEAALAGDLPLVDDVVRQLLVFERSNLLKAMAIAAETISRLCVSCGEDVLVGVPGVTFVVRTDGVPLHRPDCVVLP